MKKSFIGIIGILIILISCKKTENTNEIQKTRQPFLVIDDTSNCNYISFDSNILEREKDSIDLNFDNKKDLEFLIEDTMIDNCDENLANCPPDAICDCWPYYATNFYINLPDTIEIAVDSNMNIKKFNANDTISNRNKWVTGDKIYLFQSTYIFQSYSETTNNILGLRTVNNLDTIYSWIHIKYEESNIKIEEISTQK